MIEEERQDSLSHSMLIPPIQRNWTHFFVITILSILISTLIFKQYGVKIMVDSARYLEYANSLKEGFYIDPHNIWYFTYTLFIFIIQALSGSENELNIVIAQYILHLISLFFLYKTCFNLFKSYNTSFICVIVYLLFYEVTLWNSYILCESIYISLTCISFYFLSLNQIVKVKKSSVLMIFLIVLLTIITKPTGVALFASIASILIIKNWNKVSNLYLKCFLSFILTITLFFTINRMLATFYVIENYQMGEVIFALNTLPYQPDFYYLILDVPNNLELLDKSYPPLFQIVYFIIFNFKYWITLLFTKFFFYLFHIRPFWSLEHNYYNLLILLPTYYYVLKYILSRRIDKTLRLFALLFFLSHTLISGITWVDWDGRFFMPLVPILVILSSPEIYADLKKLRLIILSAFRLNQA